jgi:hypothetical protein
MYLFIYLLQARIAQSIKWLTTGMVMMVLFPAVAEAFLFTSTFRLAVLPSDGYRRFFSWNVMLAIHI